MSFWIAAFSGALDRACAFAEDVAGSRTEAAARQVASALYHVTTAIGLAHEARAANLPHRLALARMAFSHSQGHSRRYCQVRSLVRYPQHRILPRPTETRLLAAFLRPFCKQWAQPPQLLRLGFARSRDT